MEVRGFTVSRTLRERCWTLYGYDPAEFLADTDTVDTGVYRLESRPVPGQRQAVYFRWIHHDGTPLPSLVGKITSRSFGPIMWARVDAAFELTDDAAGHLFEQIAEPFARASLRSLLRQLRAIMSGQLQ